MIARPHPALRISLTPLAWLYALILRTRNRLYARAAAVKRAPVAVISVGNLTVGGTGKTPIVAWIARHLAAAGRRPAIVSRGYGGRAGRGPRLVSTGDGPLCDADVCGDEPLLLARSLPGVIVIVGSDRHAGAVAASERGADTVVLDDGFQHRRLARDLDIVLLDAAHPFGDHRLLPAGSLREPVSALARADLVLVTRTAPQQPIAEIEREVRRHQPDAPILRADHRVVGFVDTDGRAVDTPPRAVAFCGIAQPTSFRRDLERQGLQILEFRAFRDHHRFSRDELDALRRAALEHGACLVTTEKDLARLGDRAIGAPTLVALRIDARVHDPQILLQAMASLRETGR